MSNGAPRITMRQRHKLGRAAFDFSGLASRLRAAGFDRIADKVSSAASLLGDAGRTLENELEG
ncbi:MAG: hypothetical protein O9972_39715 [Burkholderiales bacterium]|nr:hypothetical protein [Burkholderiales bacterium]